LFIKDLSVKIPKQYSAKILKIEENPHKFEYSGIIIPAIKGGINTLYLFRLIKAC